jgi:hypothetical protein
MLPREVYNMYDGLYHKFEYKKFKNNLKYLNNVLSEKKASAEEDAAAFKSGYLEDKKPKEVYDSNPVHAEFTFKQFSDNYFKEKHKDEKKAYWDNVRAKKELKRNRT